MKKIFLATTLITSLNLTTIYTATAQNPPAETYQPGFWQPIARVDLKSSITVKLVNQTDFKLDYAITEDNMKPVQIEPRETVTLTNIQVPIYIVIYPDSSDPNSSTINLKYKVAVNAQNIVTVDVKQIDNDTPGNRTLNIQKTGAIYAY